MQNQKSKYPNIVFACSSANDSLTLCYQQPFFKQLYQFQRSITSSLIALLLILISMRQYKLLVNSKSIQRKPKKMIIIDIILLLEVLLQNLIIGHTTNVIFGTYMVIIMQIVISYELFQLSVEHQKMKFKKQVKLNLSFMILFISVMILLVAYLFQNRNNSSYYEETLDSREWGWLGMFYVVTISPLFYWGMLTQNYYQIEITKSAQGNTQLLLSGITRKNDKFNKKMLRWINMLVFVFPVFSIINFLLTFMFVRFVVGDDPHIIANYLSVKIYMLEFSQISCSVFMMVSIKNFPERFMQFAEELQSEFNIQQVEEIRNDYQKSSIFIEQSLVEDIVEVKTMTEISSVVNFRSHPPSLKFWDKNKLHNKSFRLPKNQPIVNPQVLSTGPSNTKISTATKSFHFETGNSKKNLLPQIEYIISKNPGKIRKKGLLQKQSMNHYQQLGNGQYYLIQVPYDEVQF